MLNVVVECLRFAYTFLEVIVNYLSKPSRLINSLLYDNTANKYISHVPSHLAVLYTDESAISLEALSKLIVHSAHAGIRRVTLYDPWTSILSKQKILQQLTHDYMLKSCKKEAVRIVFYDDSDDISCCTAVHTVVKVLGAKDGRQSVVRACRKLCTECKPKDITVERISECLAEENICEPDYLLQIGDLETMAGYSPWVLRITEILRLKSLPSSFSYHQFLTFLHDYSSRDRRCGR